MAGLPWIPLDVEFPESRKAIALGIALEQPMAWAHVVKLWTKAAKHAADGRVEGPAAVATIEQWASWNGSPGALVEAMALPHVALLDHTDSGFYIHDWHQHCGAHVEKREKDRQRMKRVRSAKRARTVRERNANVRGEREREIEIETERKKEQKPSLRAPDGAAPRAGPDPRFQPFVAAAHDAFRDLRGADLDIDGHDGKRLREFLARQPRVTVEEFVFRWRTALQLQRYPGCAKVAHLCERWNELAGTGPPGAKQVTAAASDRSAFGKGEVAL